MLHQNLQEVRLSGPTPLTFILFSHRSRPKDVQQLLGTTAASGPTRLSITISKSSANRLCTATTATATATTVSTATSIPAESSYRIRSGSFKYAARTVWDSASPVNSGSICSTATTNGYATNRISTSTSTNATTPSTATAACSRCKHSSRSSEEDVNCYGNVGPNSKSSSPIEVSLTYSSTYIFDNPGPN